MILLSTRMLGQVVAEQVPKAFSGRPGGLKLIVERRDTLLVGVGLKLNPPPVMTVVGVPAPQPTWLAVVHVDEVFCVPLPIIEIPIPECTEIIVLGEVQEQFPAGIMI